MATPRILHLHSSFDPGGPQDRAVRLMNAWGPRARHVLVSAEPDALGARAAIASDVRYEVAQDPPPLTGRPSVARYEAIARMMRGFDLVLTHGWGAIDGVMARRVFGRGAPPVIHHEDGPGPDEGAERSLYRRIALSAAQALVVPGGRLEQIALRTWRQPRGRVHRIPHGVDLDLYAGARKARPIPGLTRRPNEIVVGTIAAFQPADDLPALVTALGGVSGRVRLVIVGDGPERAAVQRAADAMGLSDRLVLPGRLAEPHRFLRQFDLFALASGGARLPMGLVEAMAAGLPIAAAANGEVADTVSGVNRPCLAASGDPLFLRESIQALVADADLRTRVGAANRAVAEAEHGQEAMIARHAALYERAMGRPGALLT